MTRSWQFALSIAVVCGIAGGTDVSAQSAAPVTASTTVPRSVPFNGQVVTPTGEARTGTVMLTFALYTDQLDGAPIWTEQQQVTLDNGGRYSLVLGSVSADGLPADAFAAGTPRWLGVQVEAEKEQPRMMLLSVPYALKAGDADTIGGKPISDFVLNTRLFDSVTSTLKEAGYPPRPSNPTASTVGRLAKFIDTANNTGDSVVIESGGFIGINTIPSYPFQVVASSTYQAMRLDTTHPVGSSFTLGPTAGGAHVYSFLATGPGASTGAGYLTIYDEGFGQYRMVINPSGNVGIGTTTPGFPLTFPSTLGDKISLWGQSGNHYGFGIQGALLQVHSDAVGANIGFGYGQSSAFTENVRFKGNGNVEIDRPNANNGLFNNGLPTGAGLSFGLNSGEGIASQRTAGDNQFGLDFYTGFAQRLNILQDGRVTIGAPPPLGAFGNLTVTASGAGAQGVVVVDRTTDDGVLVRFRRNGITQGSIDVAGGVVTYNAFTGSHYARTNETIERGMLVSLTGENGRFEDRPESEILYGITKSRRANDPAIMGAYLARQTPAASALSDSTNPHLVEAVGNGEMWVIDTGRNLEAGEYLISSAVAGHAMTDPGTFDVSYIVARVAEPIDWNNVTATAAGADGRKHKRALVSVFFENFVIDRTRGSAKETNLVKMREEIASLTAKLAALEARDQAREARLTRLENASGNRPARSVNASYKMIKADASFGAIRAGDLLTTSTNPGYAMKLTDNVAAIGAIIGKALGSLDAGTGTIPVLVVPK